MTRTPGNSTPFVVGWEEWLALPDLGLPAIRAKIDTGAKTSALHAFEIEPFGPSSAPMIRFGVHPIPGREDIARYCSAAVTDRREVTSSNGERETRYVIRTRLVLGDRDWGDIEATLANRESMAYRMLLGRQAIRGGMLVDPAASFLQPRLSHKLYAALPKQMLPARRLKIALVATKPARASNQMLKAQAEQRGHSLDILPLDTLALDFSEARARLLADGRPVDAYDAVIARATGGTPGLAAAVVRQLQQAGAVALNEADAIERLRNPYFVASLLHAHGLPGLAAPPQADVTRLLVILGTVVASHGEESSEAKLLAARVAGALGLGMVAVEIARVDGAARIAGIDANPPLTGFAQPMSLARTIIAALEQRVRTPRPVPAAAEGDV